MGYYLNLAIVKELLFTPIINYGGGGDSSQRFIFDYNQRLSGGHFKTDLTFSSVDVWIDGKGYKKWSRFN